MRNYYTPSKIYEMRKKILYFYPVNTSFVKKDLNIFTSHYDVVSFSFEPKRKFFTPLFFLKQLLFLILNIKRCDILICQFAGYHSFLPSVLGKVFKKPSLLILAGTDCVSFPSINYGNFNKKLQGVFTKLSLKYCTHVAPVHKSLILCDYTYTNDDYPKQGYLYHYPHAKAKQTEIFYGYESDKFYRTNVICKKQSFLTVAQTIEKPTFYRKGIDLILAIAVQFPDAQFTIIGGGTNILNIPSNVSILQRVPYEKLSDIYSKHEFYFQLSICEGFPNALCEAMLCECIPIGSAVAAIPDIIADTGFVLKKRNLDNLHQLISEALNCDKALLSKKARQRIIKNYPIKRREDEFVKLVDCLIKK